MTEVGSDEEKRVNFIEGLRLGTRWTGQFWVVLGLKNLDTPFVSNLSKALEIIREILFEPGIVPFREFLDAGANRLFRID